jgi:hypothetical protein
LLFAHLSYCSILRKVVNVSPKGRLTSDSLND